MNKRREKKNAHTITHPMNKKHYGLGKASKPFSLALEKKNNNNTNKKDVRGIECQEKQNKETGKTSSNKIMIMNLMWNVK